MEVYFKNLTSEEVSVEKLVSDLMMLAHDVEDLVKVSGASLGEESREQLMSALERVKGRCERIKQQAMAGARATDRAIREYPYPALGVAAGVGFLVGALLFRRR